MIKFKVLLFGVTRDLAGKSQLDIELEEGSNDNFYCFKEINFFPLH